jgi:hypothetical protein
MKMTTKLMSAIVIYLAGLSALVMGLLGFLEIVNFNMLVGITLFLLFRELADIVFSIKSQKE